MYRGLQGTAGRAGPWEGKERVRRQEKVGIAEGASSDVIGEKLKEYSKCGSGDCEKEMGENKPTGNGSFE